MHPVVSPLHYNVVFRPVSLNPYRCFTYSSSFQDALFLEAPLFLVLLTSFTVLLASLGVTFCLFFGPAIVACLVAGVRFLDGTSEASDSSAFSFRERFFPALKQNQYLEIRHFEEPTPRSAGLLQAPQSLVPQCPPATRLLKCSHLHFDQNSGYMKKEMTSL